MEKNKRSLIKKPDKAPYVYKLPRSLKCIEKSILYLEDESRDIGSYVLTFFFAISLRTFLEVLIDASNVPLNWQVIVHYDLAYIFLAAGIILIVSLISDERVERLCRVVLACFSITIIVPIIDISLSYLIYYKPAYSYIFPQDTKNIIRDYFLFFGANSGITVGMRTEIMAVMVITFIYVYFKSGSVIRSIAGSVSVYTYIFIALALPFVMIGIADLTGAKYETDFSFFIQSYLFLLMPILLIMAFIGWPKYVKTIIKDLRITRVIHYQLMVILGLFLGKAAGTGQQQTTLQIILIMVALLFAWIFSVITNNLADRQIDRISNPARPSVTGIISLDLYKRVAYIFLLLVASYSLAAGFQQFYLMLCFIGAYFIYSMPPLRFKRIPFFSKGLIALNCIVMILAGYTLAGHEIKDFSPRLAAFLIIALTACINFIDIKDIEGDRIEGIKTIPVLLGLKWSKLVIGLFFVTSYVLFPFVIGHADLWPISLIFGLAIFIVMNLKKYNEQNIFIIYLSSFILFLIYLTGHE